MSLPAHWRKTRWNNYRLVDEIGAVHDFKTYAELYRYCVQHGIDAVTA